MPKSKYDTHIKPNLQLIISWKEAGKTDEQVAEKLKVACSTLREHARAQPELSAALRASKEKLIANLKKSLWEEALGYEYDEIQEHAEIYKDADGKETKSQKLKRTKVRKKARGVPNLLIFALCNMCPEEFQRVDKEAVKDLEDKIDEKINQNFSNDAIKKAFNVLYENSVKNKTEKEAGKNGKK